MESQIFSEVVLGVKSLRTTELVDTGNQQSNKEVDWQKVFYVF